MQSAAKENAEGQRPLSKYDDDEDGDDDDDDDDVGDDVDVGRCSEQQKKRREDKDRCLIIIELLPRLLGRTQENASNL